MSSGNIRNSVHITNETLQNKPLSIFDDARNEIEILKLEQDNSLLYRVKWWGAWLLIGLSYVLAIYLFYCFDVNY